MFGCASNWGDTLLSAVTSRVKPVMDLVLLLFERMLCFNNTPLQRLQYISSCIACRTHSILLRFQEAGWLAVFDD